MSQRFYHVIVVHVDARTGERLGDSKTYLTGYPMPHHECMTLVNKWTPYRPKRATVHTAWRLEEKV